MDLFSQVMSLLFNILSRFVIAFLPRRNASFNFVAAVTIHSNFGAQENRLFTKEIMVLISKRHIAI